MVNRFGILIVCLVLAGCHPESVFASNPRESSSFLLSSLIGGAIIWVIYWLLGKGEKK